MRSVIRGGGDAAEEAHAEALDEAYLSISLSLYIYIYIYTHTYK